MRPALVRCKRSRLGLSGDGYSVDGNRECHYAAAVAEETSKVNHRLTLLAACTGVILGFGGAMAEGPGLVSLAFKPLIQDQLSCSSSVNEGLRHFVQIQLVCAALGGVCALVAVFFWRRFFRRRAEAKQRTTG